MRAVWAISSLYGEAHLAGSHLLDPATGDYNFAYIKQYLPNVRVVATLLRRKQGLIVAKGNPKNIASLGNLARLDMRFVNPAARCGHACAARLSLEQARHSPESVSGYQR